MKEGETNGVKALRGARWLNDFDEQRMQEQEYDTAMKFARETADEQLLEDLVVLHEGLSMMISYVGMAVLQGRVALLRAAAEAVPT